MSQHSTFSLLLHHIFNIVFAIMFLRNSLNVLFSEKKFFFFCETHLIYKVPRLIIFSNHLLNYTQFPEWYNDYLQRKCKTICKGRRIEIGKCFHKNNLNFKQFSSWRDWIILQNKSRVRYSCLLDLETEDDDEVAHELSKTFEFILGDSFIPRKKS